MITVPMRVSVQSPSIRMRVGITNPSVRMVINTKYEAIEGEAYSGDYIVTPSDEAQILETGMKVLNRNIVVNPIPSNYGKITYNGSVITVT